MMENEQRVFYINENTFVLEGNEQVQYVIPSELTESGGLLVQEDGMQLTHYLMDSDNIAALEDKGHIVIQQTQYAEIQSQNDMPGTSADENQIYQIEQDESVTQLVLNEEQCRLLQDSGQVILQQGSRRFLLDAAGLRELGPLEATGVSQNVHYIIPELGDPDESVTLVPYDEIDVNAEGVDVLNHSSAVTEGMDITMEDSTTDNKSKETVYGYLNERCAIMMQNSENIEQKFTSNESQHIVYVTEELMDCQNLQSDRKNIVVDSSFDLQPIEQQQEGGIDDEEEFGNHGILDEQEITKDIVEEPSDIDIQRLRGQDEIMEEKHTMECVDLMEDDNEVDTEIDDPLQILEVDRRSFPEIRNGKIILMPEDVHVKQTKKLMELHTKKMRANSPHPMSTVHRETTLQHSEKSTSQKLFLSMKNAKIYIGETPEGKKIYGKVIDYKPSSESKRLLEKELKSVNSVKSSMDSLKNQSSKLIFNKNKKNVVNSLGTKILEKVLSMKNTQNPRTRGVIYSESKDGYMIHDTRSSRDGDEIEKGISNSNIATNVTNSNVVIRNKNELKITGKETKILNKFMKSNNTVLVKDNDKQKISKIIENNDSKVITNCDKNVDCAKTSSLDVTADSSDNVIDILNVSVQNVTENLNLSEQHVTEGLNLSEQNVTEGLNLSEQNVTESLNLSEQNVTNISSEDITEENCSELTEIIDNDDRQTTEYQGPNQQDLETLTKIICSLVKLPNVSSSVLSRDLMVVKQHTEDDGTIKEKIYTGKMVNMDQEGEGFWNFIYMPELAAPLDGKPADKGNILKNRNFLMIKFIKNSTLNTTDIIILDKVKTDEKQKFQISELTNNKCKEKAEKKLMMCQYCKKTFYRSSNLSRHLAIHAVRESSTNAVHICSHCNCVFRFPSTLTRHVLQQHTVKAVFMSY